MNTKTLFVEVTDKDIAANNSRNERLNEKSSPDEIVSAIDTSKGCNALSDLVYRILLSRQNQTVIKNEDEIRFTYRIGKGRNAEKYSQGWSPLFQSRDFTQLYGASSARSILKRFAYQTMVNETNSEYWKCSVSLFDRDGNELAHLVNAKSQ